MANLFGLLLLIAFFVIGHANCGTLRTLRNEPPKLRLPKYSDKNGEQQWFPRIVGGTPAYPGEFHSKISIQSVAFQSHFCGGTVIDENHVITAAHCVVSDNYVVLAPQSIQVMGDDLSVSNVNVNISRQIRSIQRIIPHPQYNISTFENDIAVLEVLLPFNFTGTFYPINRTNSTPPDNTLCSVAGWGALYETGWGTYDLQRVNASVINRSICNGIQSYQGLVVDGMICAGDMAGGRDSCQGDSGGGLICNNLLAGVVSFGYGCARPNFPGVYTDISYFNQFINNTISESQNNNNNGTTTIQIPTTTAATTTPMITHCTTLPPPTSSSPGGNTTSWIESTTSWVNVTTSMPWNISTTTPSTNGTIFATPETISLEFS